MMRGSSSLLLLAILLLLIAVEISTANDYPKIFDELARNMTRVTDKVTSHRYQEMYGTHLLPFVKRKHAAQESIKFLEIGLGCGMVYGAGAGMDLWMRIFKNTDELWSAEYNKRCVREERVSERYQDKVKFLTGDQSNSDDIKKWLEQSGGGFDVIVDDGGHSNDMIFTSFEGLWERGLKPGGLYFIEDLLFSRYPERLQLPASNKGVIMIDYIKDWVEQLLTPAPNPVAKYPLPKGLKWIFCQYDACVLAKCRENDVAQCSPKKYG